MIECTKGDTGFRGERGQHTRRIRQRAECVVELPADGCLREPVEVSSGLLRFSQSLRLSASFMVAWPLVGSPVGGDVLDRRHKHYPVPDFFVSFSCEFL